jgi:hypothetical protein
MIQHSSFDFLHLLKANHIEEEEKGIQEMKKIKGRMFICIK